MQQSLSVSGNITLKAGLLVTGNETLIANASGTLTSNGFAWPNAMNFGGASQTFTLADDWDIDGTITFSGTTAITMTGQTIYAGGGLTQTTTAAVSGTTAIIMNGTGTISNSSTGTIANNLTFNTAGTLTFSGTALRYKTRTLTYTAGTMSMGTSTFRIDGSCTLNTSGMTFANVTMIVTGTVTLSSNLNMSGDLTTGSTTTAQTFNGAFNINVGEDLIHNGTTGSVAGTATIVLTGTGNWSMPNSSIAGYNIAIVLNTAGTITMTTDIFWGNTTSSFVWTAGTLVSTGYAFRIGTTTMNFNGNTINSLHLDRSSTGVLTLSGNVVVSGNLSNSDSASYMSIVSSVPATQRILTLLQGATQDLCKMNATDIDSSAGQTIFTHRGVLSNATNWASYTTPRGTIGTHY